MHILIAGANLYENRCILIHLENWEHTVAMVTSGQAALRRLLHDPVPDLALLDRALPGMDAFSLCRWMRSHFKSHPPHVVVMTLPGKDVLAHSVAAEADALMLKPLTGPQLHEQLALAEIAKERNHSLLHRRLSSTQRQNAC